MIKVYYDSERDAVIIEFSGKVDKAQAEQYYANLEKTVPPNCQGFKLLVDFSKAEALDPEISGTIKKAMDFFNKRRVAEVVRVIPDPDHDIGVNIMSPFHYSKDVKFRTFQSRQEAEARL